MKIAALLLCLIAATTRGGDPLDKASTDALNQTMDVLRSASERGAEISKSPQARAADSQVKALAGTPQNTERIYELAAQVMQNLAQEGGGDPEKMMKILEEAQKNPTSFANRFTPEQKKLLKEIATDIEKAKGIKSVP